MAVIGWTTVQTPADGRGFKLVKWTPLAADDTALPFNVAEYSDKTIQIEGTLGTGVTIEGSLDPDESAYEALHDAQGTALSAITAAKIVGILEHCYWLRPTVASGASGVTVWLVLASTK